jgi:hypothetical protein
LILEHPITIIHELIRLAFVVFIFIGKYLLYENSFDKFWTGQDRIYRINRLSTHNGEITYDGAKSPRGIYFAKDEIPDLEACGYAFHENCQVKNKTKALKTFGNASPIGQTLRFHSRYFAFGTIGFHIFRTAQSNPVDALRYE